MSDKSEVHRRKTLRLKNYDYSQAGAYFVTICTAHRKNLFGQIVNGEMLLNQTGEIVQEEWLKTGTLRTYVTMEQFVVIPNHFHGIIWLSYEKLLAVVQHAVPLQNDISAILFPVLYRL